MKILFLCEHLSTGGMPQYTYILSKKLIDDGQNIYLIEFNDITGGAFVVQKNLLKELLGHKLHTLSSANKKQELLTLIKKIDPDILHIQEFPEMWLQESITRELYKNNRKYKIIETSHDSGFDPKNKRFLPDGWAFISNFHPDQYKDFGIPYRIVEYPIENYTRPDRTESLIELGLDPNKIHILNIGLFTPRKNQAEVIKIARYFEGHETPNLQFHFVGNQAGNFEHYWKPLMENLPKNCKIWGERKDPDKFYSSMDFMYFASKGTDNDRETNPLVIREALSWHMPILMRNLPVYMGKYDKYPEITYIDDNIEKTIDIISMGSWRKSVETPITREKALEICDRILETAEKERIVEGEVVSINDEYINDEYDFNINTVFDELDNKIEFYFYSGDPFIGKISIRDMDTYLPIYSFPFEIGKGFTNFWSIPIPNHILKFKDLPKFRGFVIEVYNKNENIVITNELIINKDQEKYFDKLDVGPYDCLFINHREFFVDDIYNNIIKKNDIVVDIGANSGMFTLYALSKEAEKVYAIEPTKQAFNNLKKVTKGKNVILINEGLLDYVGNAEIAVSENNTTISSLLPEAIDKNQKYQKETIKLNTFEGFLKDYNIQHINLLKVDIEGSEYKLFDSMEPSSIDIIDRVLIEFHYNKGDRLTKLCEKLYKHYKFIEIYKQSTNQPWQGNDNGIIIASNDRPIDFLLSIKYVKCNYPKFTYAFNKSFYANISFKETKTDLNIYSIKGLVAENMEYWASLPSRLEDISSVTMVVNGKNIYKEMGKLNIKQQKFIAAPYDNSAWFTYYEIFIKEDYTGRYCKVEKDDIVLDLGANYGFFTKYALINGASMVYSVEPNPKTLKYLKKGIKNQAVKIIPAAINKKTGQGLLNQYNESTISLMKGLEIGQTADFLGESTVKTYNINDLIIENKIDKIDFLKFDIEGSEYDMFDTINEEFLLKIPKLAGEFHNIKPDKPWKYIVEKLEKLGFIVQIDERGNNTCRMLAWKENNE